MIQKNRITKEGYLTLRRRYDELIVELDSTTRDMSSAREAGDLRENSDYKTSQDRISIIKRDLASLREKLDSAIVVDVEAERAAADAAGLPKEIRFGTRFMAIIPVVFDDALPHPCQLVGELEADYTNAIFAETSRIGGPLLGKKENEEFSIQQCYAKIIKIY